MKVKELIEILSKMTPDAKVVVEDERTGHESTNVGVKEYYKQFVYITAPIE